MAHNLSANADSLWLPAQIISLCTPPAASRSWRLTIQNGGYVRTQH